MTKHKNQFDDIFSSFLGAFDQQFITPAQKYPPYNITKVTTMEDDEVAVGGKVSNVKYIVEAALAGFTKDMLSINVDGGKLIISSDDCGEDVENAGETTEYLHRGIARRPFTLSLLMGNGFEVVDATFKDGILAVTVEDKSTKTIIPIKSE